MSVPPDLVPETFAERLYASLDPLTGQDALNGWALLIYANAIGQMFQVVEELVRDQNGDPGWSLLLDLPRCPPEALPWLGQFVGVRMPSGATADQQRTIITGHSGWARGTPAAIESAVAATLTGAKTVVFRERDTGDAYQLGVVTYTDETPDPAATLAALMAAKPAGIKVNYSTLAGQDWQHVKDTRTNWQAVKDRYVDWSAVLTDR